MIHQPAAIALVHGQNVIKLLEILVPDLSSPALAQVYPPLFAAFLCPGTRKTTGLACMVTCGIHPDFMLQG